MAYISFQPSDFFNTKLYTGNSSTNAITGVGFQPDFTWLKKRNGVDGHNLFDTVRGATKVIQSSSSNAESTEATKLQSWQSDGFTLGSNAEVNGSFNFASYNWKAGTTSGKTTSGETITPTAYSINPTSGIGIYAWNGSAGAGTIAHGLSSAPKFFMVKRLDGIANWYGSSSMLTSGDWSLYLNNTNAQTNTGSALWNSTFPSSTVMSLGADGDVNGASRNFIMYAFAPVKGFSAIGKYEGNGNVDGPFIYTGFRPGFVIIKNIDRSEGWNMYDTKRSPVNLGTSNTLKADSTVAEDDDSTIAIDILSNGFKVRTTSTEINLSTSMYMAFAEFPFVSSNSKAGTAR